MWKLLGHNRHIVRLAGLSGAAAVILGAYGAHYHFTPKDEDIQERDPKQIFEMTNRYHFIHSLALLAAPFARRPYLVSHFDLKDYAQNILSDFLSSRTTRRRH